MNIIHIAIIGVGRWGTHMVRKFSQHPRVKLRAIVDSSPERLTRCHQQFSLDEGVILTTSWENIRNLEGLQAIVIVTPASTHYPLIKEALHLGYHVLVEKPLTLHTTQCQELTQLAKDKGLVLFVDHTYLFNPVVEKGRDIVQSLGELRYGYASRTHIGPVRQDVDVLWDLAIHDICIFNYWVGETPKQVQAIGKSWLQKNLADLVWVTLIYPSGFQVYIHLCWLNPDKQRRLSIVGTKGSLIFDELSVNQPLLLQKGYLEPVDNQFIPEEIFSEKIDVEKAEPLARVVDGFLECILGTYTCASASGDTAIKLVNILECLSLSLQEQGRMINVNE